MLLLACGGEVRDATDQSFGTSSPAGSGSDTGDGATQDTTAAEPKLDLGDPEGPSVECASITQTGTVVRRPSDVILVGVGDPLVMPDYDFRWWVNDLPAALVDGGGDDARVFVLVGGDPSEHLDNDAEQAGVWDCGQPLQWYCGGGGVDVDVIDVPIPEETPLQSVLDTAPQWLDLLRPEAGKHILFWAPYNQDESIDAPDFIAQATAFDESWEGFQVHALAHAAERAQSPTGALRVATELTGGLYDDGTVEDIDAGFFETAVALIADDSLACEYDIPAPPDGLTFDPEKLNVEYDEGMGLETIGYVDSASACAQVGAGWYYDDPTEPTRIIMCPFTCQRFEMAANATIDIKFGCATIPAG